MHKLSPPLANILDMEMDTTANIIMALWQYIKLNGLQDTEDKRYINCDEMLERVKPSKFRF
jgi:SWI/SNF-related matrix-associated actin-dependent regulator of chromatin subfamily D